MKLSGKKRLAGFLGVLMVFSLILGLQTPTLVKAENPATISVSYKEGSENNGKVQIKAASDSDWTDCSNDGTSQPAVAVRIVPNTGYRIDWTAIALRVDGEDILTDDIRASLFGVDGYSLTSDTAYALEEVEFSVDDGGSGGSGGEGGEGITIDFTDGTVNENVITYTVAGEDVTVTVAGATVSDSRITVPYGDEERVTFTLSNNYNPETMEVLVYAEDGFEVTLAVTDFVTSLAARNSDGGLPDALKLVVTDRDANHDNGGEQPSNGASRPAELYTGEARESNWSVTGDGDIYINGVMLPTLDMTSGNASYNLSDDGKVYFEFSCFHNMRYTVIKINGVDYSAYIPSTQQELLEALDANGNDQKISFVLPGIDYASDYVIETNLKVIDESDAEYEPIGNFLWTYQESDAGSDDYLDHGKLAFVSLKYDGTVYGSLEELEAADKCYLHFSDVNDGPVGSAVLPYGAELTVRLLPEYGYQLSSFTINGGVFEAGTEIGVYTFTIPRGNFHLGAHFTQVADEVQVSGSNGISGGNIRLGENEIDMGSAVLSISDTDTTGEEQKAFAEAADGYTVDSYLELSLNQVVYKGNENDYWETDMSTLNSAADISLELSDTLESDDVTIIHQNHEGEYEVIPAEYDSDTNTVTFSTDSFSKYAIASKTKNSETQDETDYKITAGADSGWTLEDDGSLTITGNGDFSKFTGVKVNGSLLDTDNYDAKKGSTVITLKAAYLNTLSAGTYTFEILWTDGSASTTFTIKEKTSGNDSDDKDGGSNSDGSSDNGAAESEHDNSDASVGDTRKKDAVPKTGEDTSIVWLFGLMTISAAGMVFAGKKRR
ncbi:MAG: hypothetical protein ACI4AD_09055 [Roseburia sp.]